MSEDIAAIRAAGVRRAAGASHARGGITPCPACAAEHRGEGDSRPPVGVRPDDLGWRCHACGATGDALDLLGLRIHKRRGNELTSSEISGLSPKRQDSPPLLPDIESAPKLDVAALRIAIQKTKVVTEDPRVVDWLISRRFRPDVTVSSCVFRALPSNWSIPGWPRDWSYGWPIIAILYDHTGSAKAFQGRAVSLDTTPKTRNILKQSVKGLWFANKQAISWLRGEAFRDVLIVEGFTDFMRAIHLFDGPVISGFEGTFSTASSLPWPRATNAWVATDNDEKGNAYAAQLKAGIGKAYARVKLNPGQDFDETFAERQQLTSALVRAEKPAARAPAWEAALAEMANATDPFAAWERICADDRTLVEMARAGAIGRAREAALKAGLTEVAANVIRTRVQQAETRIAGDRTATAASGQDMGDLEIPPGYEVSARGIFALKTTKDGEPVARLVASAPIAIHQRAADVDTGAATIELGWDIPGWGWRKCWFNRDIIASSQKIVGLARDYLPVTSNNSAELVRYLAAFEAHNKEQLIPAQSVTRSGWIGEAFMVGRHEIKNGVPNNEIKPAINEGSAEVLDAFGVKGDPLVWGELAQEIASTYPRLHLALLVALVPPLLEVLDARSFCAEFVGSTSLGKTTALLWGAGAWGRPHSRATSPGLVRTWESTPTWIERYASTARCLPIFLDDTKRARHAEDCQRIIYEIAGEQGAGRGSIDGMRKSAVWSTVLLSTGETATTTLGKARHGGANARLLSIWGSPFGGASLAGGRLAERIEDVTAHCHGHAGMALVVWLTSSQENKVKARLIYREERERWAEMACDNPVLRRAAAYVACIGTAAHILQATMGVATPVSSMEAAWEAAKESGDASQVARHAMRALLSWFFSNPARIWDGTASMSAAPPFHGWIGAVNKPMKTEEFTEAWIIAGQARDWLSSSGYDCEAVIRGWIDAGWLCPDGITGRADVRRSLAGNPQRVHVISRKSASEAGW